MPPDRPVRPPRAADTVSAVRLYVRAAGGAGPGFFGVVTRYYLQVFALPKVIRTSTLTCPLEDADHAAHSFAPANRQRVQQLRRKYDPEGVFFHYLGQTRAPGQA